jgi:hypothetical protein
MATHTTADMQEYLFAFLTIQKANVFTMAIITADNSYVI